MTTILAFIFVLGLLVFVHELGHFIAAKRSGIRVERFSLGFPPKLIGKTVGETEYCIGVIPLGGYVKMVGENEFDEGYVAQPGDFMAASLWKRFIVITAGPFMNFVTAILLFFVIYWATGIPEPVPNTVSSTSILPGSPAENAGLTAGAEILSIDGIIFEDYAEMSGYISQRPNQELLFSWKAEDGVHSEIIIPLENTVADSAGVEKIVGRIGIGIGPMFEYRPTGPWQALKEGTDATLFLTGEMFKIIWRLITQQESLKNLGGPVMIAQQAGKAAEQGFLSLLGLAAFLSVNLAILNILPIPVLDGGHLVFLSIEGVLRRPVSIKGRLIAQQIGMAVLLLLMVVVTYNDVARLLTGIFK
ncbi:MAG: RIP metalloprotease RseP [candidate division Zixibacteria bacterium]|nr:RIP metalloprotease RseP [candidate division Zixibacteria bacterium]